MTTKTLVIGTGTEGIGDAFVDEWILRNYGRLGETLYTPTIEELDVTSLSSIETYIRSAGPFDEIVYSAGVSRLQWIADIADDYASGYELTQAINTTGVVLVASAHAESFAEARVRYVVLVSDAAHTPMRGSIAYCVSKAGAEMAVKCLARELAPEWTVVGVSPGVVEDTGMTRQLAEDIPAFRDWTPEQARAYEGIPPIGRRVDKQEVAKSIFFALSGPQALNGSIITINGGK